MTHYTKGEICRMAVEMILVVVAIVAAVVWMEYFPVKTDSGLDFSKRMRSPLAVHLVIDVHAESFDATIPSPAEPHPDTAETAVVKRLPVISTLLIQFSLLSSFPENIQISTYKPNIILNIEAE